MIGTADFDLNDFTKPRAGDERLAVRFFRKAKQDPARSQAEGRPIFAEVDYIQVMVPGDRDSSHIRPVAPGDKVRFAKQYEHWKATQTNDVVVGTPLEAWGILTLAQVEEYRYFGIRTIEQMADLRDDVCLKIPGSLQLKQRAAEFVKLAKDAAPMKKMQSELEKRDADIDALKIAVADQAAIIKRMEQDRSGTLSLPKK